MNHVDSFSLFLSLVPISVFPPLASEMPLIALYTALIIECILCRQWILVPWALWSRIHGTNAGWQPGQFEALHSKSWPGHICLADWPIYGPPIPELLCTQLTCTHTCVHTHCEDSRTIYSVICKAHITLLHLLWTSKGHRQWLTFSKCKSSPLFSLINTFLTDRHTIIQSLYIIGW